MALNYIQIVSCAWNMCSCVQIAENVLKKLILDFDQARLIKNSVVY